MEQEREVCVARIVLGQESVSSEGSDEQLCPALSACIAVQWVTISVICHSACWFAEGGSLFNKMRLIPASRSISSVPAVL